MIKYVKIAMASPADAEIIIGNLPASIRNDLISGPFVDASGVLNVPSDAEDQARLIAANIDEYASNAWPVEQVHIAWLKAALAEAGKLDAVNAAVSKSGPVSSALWEYATTIRADDRDVVAIAAALRLDLTAMFRRAHALSKERRA